MARTLLPIQHDWVESLVRRLTWPTAVIGTTDGTEQRIAQRAADDPAEQLVVRLTALRPTAAARIRRAVLTAPDRAVWCPRWYDAVALAEAAPTASSALALEAGFGAGARDFVQGGQAVLWRTDTKGVPTQTELVTIESVTDDTATLDGVTALAWRAGSWLVPLLAGVLEANVEGELPSGATGQWTLTVTADAPVVGNTDADVDAAVAVVPASIAIEQLSQRGDLIPYSRGHQYQWCRATVRDAAGVVLPFVAVAWDTDRPDYVTVTPLLDGQRARIDLAATIPGSTPATITATAGGLTAALAGTIFPDAVAG